MQTPATKETDSLDSEPAVMEENSGSLSTLQPEPSTTVTREMCRARAREIALQDGRSPAEVRWEDYFQARREITGESDPDRQDAILDAAGTTVTRTALFAMNFLHLVQ